MKVLHLSQYFPPEAGAVQVRAMTVAHTLAEQGHQVTVLTELPNHPSGIIQPDFRGKWVVRTNVDGVEVWHLWVKTSPHKNFRTRLAFYLSYMAAAVVAGLFLRRKFDVIFVNSPPLFVAVAGWIISIIRRTPLVLEIQDLWPESAVVMGELKNPRFIQLAEWLEWRCYNRASRIVAVTEGIRQRLLARGVEAQKLMMAPNGSNIKVFQPSSEEGQALKADLNLEGKFVVMYGGILGLAQGLEVVLQAAQILQSRPDVQFVIVGEGPRKAELTDLKEQLNLSNTLMLPGQSLTRMKAYLSMADIALVPLRKLDLFLGALPTKMFDAWACQTPTLINVDGEARAVLEAVGAGLFVEPENPQALAEALLRLRDNPAELQQMGEAGYRAVLERYSLQNAAQQIEQALRELVEDETLETQQARPDGSVG